MSEGHKVNKAIGGREQKEKSSFDDRFLRVVADYITSPTRRNEILAAGFMSGGEMVYDMRKVTREGNEFGNSYIGLSPDNVGPLPDNPQEGSF